MTYAVQAVPRAAGRALRRRPARGRARPGLASTARANGCCASPTARRSRRVHIPEEDRGTLCVSSQVGCTLTCRFCHTGTQKLVRNLGAGEIVGQLMVARDALGEWPIAARTSGCSSNIVMMGMGEPLYNYDNVAKALQHRHGRRGHLDLAPAHHAVDRRRRADDQALRRGAGRQARDLAACRHRRDRATARAAQQEIPDRAS